VKSAARAKVAVRAPAASARPELLVQITKRTDGRSVLRCVRADGSVVWQRQDGRQAQFFPFHDLIHFALETTLGLGNGFFGLIAQGWEIDETTGTTSRSPVPSEAMLVEQLVNLFTVERIGGAPLPSATELHERLQLLVRAGQLDEARSFTDLEISAARARIDELHDAWAALPGGGTLELPFNRPG